MGRCTTCSSGKLRWRSGSGRPRLTTLLDLGCGTGAAGAAWAQTLPKLPAIVGVDVSSWALSEASRTYRAFGVAARTRLGDIATTAWPASPAAFLAAFTLNELPGIPHGSGASARLVERGERGDIVLVVEPVAGFVAPWWNRWRGVFEAAGGRAAGLEVLHRVAGHRGQARSRGRLGPSDADRAIVVVRVMLSFDGCLPPAAMFQSLRLSCSGYPAAPDVLAVRRHDAPRRSPTNGRAEELGSMRSLTLSRRFQSCARLRGPRRPGHHADRLLPYRQRQGGTLQRRSCRRRAPAVAGQPRTANRRHEPAANTSSRWWMSRADGRSSRVDSALSTVSGRRPPKRIR